MAHELANRERKRSEKQSAVAELSPAKDNNSKKTKRNAKVTDELEEATDEPIQDFTTGDDGIEGATGYDSDGSTSSQDQDGDQAGTEAPEAPSSSTADTRVHTGKLLLPPKGEELRQIKEASELFKSSSFKLQIDALLPNLAPKVSHTAPLERFLFALHTVLISIPSTKPLPPLEAARNLSSKDKSRSKKSFIGDSPIAVPYPHPNPTEDVKWTVEFESPKEITVVGSWANKIGVKAREGMGWGVDLAVEMPAALFQEKDVHNARFFHKRAFYLAYLASHLSSLSTMKDSPFKVHVAYESPGADARLTTLLLRPVSDGSPTDFSKLNAFVRLIPVIPPSSPLALHRLSPSHASIRASSASSTSEPIEPPPTPLYNSALLKCTTPRLHLLHTHALIQEVPSFTNALTLLRVWANQRGYNGDYIASENAKTSSVARAFLAGWAGRGPWWAALLGVLVNGEEPISDSGRKSAKRKLVARGLSSYQLFRAALDFLSRHEWSSQPVFARTKDGKHRHPPAEYQQYHDAVFVDASSSVNLLAGMPLSSLDLLRHDAKVTLDVLGDGISAIDPFAEAFLNDQRDMVTRFDVVLSVDIANAKIHNQSHKALDWGSENSFVINSVCSVLRRALTNRAKAIGVFIQPPETRPVSQANALPPPSSIIHIGLILDPANAHRLVDHGPALTDANTESDSHEVKVFRELWGEKSELRRFKDGRIQESVVWDVQSSDARAHIPAMIVKHILAQHFGIDSVNAVKGCQDEFDRIVRLPESISKLLVHPDRSQTGFKGAMAAFDTLVRDIKSLDEALPLALLNVSPVSSSLRYTSVFAPLPLPHSTVLTSPSCARYVPAMDVELQFERSARWPDDLVAIQKTKLAFFECISTALMERVPGLKATVVVGDESSASDIMDQGKLEILTPQGWAFTARIWHDREATLLERLTDSKNGLINRIQQNFEDKDTERERKKARDALEIYTRRFIHAPKHHRAIASLFHLFPAYSGTVRLVKRWLASHWLLGGHVSEEAVELLCASVFIGDGKSLVEGNSELVGRAGVPGSKEAGFARVVKFLACWKWEGGLVVPVYGSGGTSAEGGKNVEVKAGSAPGVWVISTEEDREGRMWTSKGPTPLAARRIKVLAKASWECLKALEREYYDVKTLFIHPTEDYDFLIRLVPTAVHRYYQNVNVDPSVWAGNRKYANLPAETELDTNKTVRVNFDPAKMYFEDLQRVYNGTAVFFYDPLGGTVIGGVWDPSLKEARLFRVLCGYSSIPERQITPEAKSKNKTKDMIVLGEAAILAEIRRMGEGLVASIVVRNNN
ncbi:Nrap protein [Rickenella mellea]|uniref:Nrap protein n=1 Tax=Rickenella mellea TaxID=50990 RepID=A0A4Y7PXX2_9AGAM|nr:Nrap protein [Rickenella mellea]